MPTKSSRWSDLVLYASILFGAVVRFAPTVISGSIINDGGMFYVMIRDLEANHFLIPVFTTYNNQNIPFAYPPFSFYIGGILNSLGLQLIDIFRWLPPLVSTLSIIVFYALACLIVNSKSKASLAAMAYALMPRTFSWYVMGGGLSRTFGVLFLLLSCAAVWLLFTKNENKYIFLSACFGAGALLSHPETGLHTFAACVLIWMFKGRSKHGMRNAILVALGVIVLTSLWWGSVLVQNGFRPFQSALFTGGHDPFFWIPWLTFDFAEERFVTIFTVLGLIGIVVQSIRRDWFLLCWLLIPFIVEPRSATAIAAIPLAMLAGIGLSDFVLPNIATIGSKIVEEYQDWTTYMTHNRPIKIVLGYILFSALIGSFFYDLSLSHYVIPRPGRDAMAWVQNNTSSNSRFIVLTGSGDPFSDPIVEWFPAFTSRKSQNTIQGKEWVLGSGFLHFHDQTELLQTCLNSTPSCVENWASANQLGFDYIYIEKSLDPSISSLLTHELTIDPGYNRIYENEGVVIFEHR